MKILVTGGAGFIGSNVADAYVAAGHEVIVLDDLSSGKKENVPAAARFVLCDIGSDTAGEAIRTFPADESHPLRPVSPHGAAKMSVELYLNFYRAQYGLDCTSLRYANVYGPRQDPHGEAGVVAIFCERLLKGQAAIVNGDGEQTRDYVYVGDTVRANVAALERGGHQHRHRHRDEREHAFPHTPRPLGKRPGGDTRARPAGGAAPVLSGKPSGTYGTRVVS